MKKTNQKSTLYPDFIAASVLELNADVLLKAGITHLVFDIDETLVPKNHNAFTDTYAKFLNLLRDKGLNLLIGSNSIRDFSWVAKSVDVTIVKPGRWSFKPFKSYYRRVIAAAGTDPSHIAMVGDKWLNDIIGANRAGLTTILVEPYARRQKLHHRYYFKRALRKA